jgi:hypothetical protein
MKRVNLMLLTVVISGVISLASVAWAVDVDQSNPKATALSFARVLEAGDGQAARQMVIGTEAEKQVLDAWVGYTAAIKKLRDAAAKKFPDKADEVTGAGMNIDSAKALEDSEVKEEADTARIVSNKPRPGQSDLCLRKVDGKWVINLSETFKGITGQNAEQMAAMMKGWADASNETAEEIEQGQYTTPADANQALSVKMIAALKSATSTTEPTTAPASQPAK